MSELRDETFWQDAKDLRSTLALHYITAIDCDHDAKTDTVRCNCSVWTGAPQPSVGAAVQEWIDHVLGTPAATEDER